MLTRDEADRNGLGPVRGVLFALAASTAFWLFLAACWMAGAAWLR